MTSIVWPRAGLVPRQPPRFNPAPRTASGGMNVRGNGQVVASDAGCWVATFSNFVVHQKQGEKKILLWDAIAGLAEGRLNALLMPVDVRGRRPLPDGVSDDLIDYPTGVPHSDGAAFSDGSLYEQSWIGVTVSADAALRAVTLQLTKVACGEIEPGMRFSIGERMYQVKKVVSQSGGSCEVTVNFPLREAVSAGAECNFDNPVCKMRLATDTEMDLELEIGRHGSPTINLVEYL